MLLTNFTLFKKVPKLSINATILFDNSNDRDNYFNNFTSITFDSLFNYRKDYGIVNLPKKIITNAFEQGKKQIGLLTGFDYGRFFDPWEKRYYYFFIQNYEYINDNTIAMSIIIDVLTTFIRTNDLNNFTNLNIEREHLTNSDYQNYLPILRRNNDVLETFSENVLVKKNILFTEFFIMITCSVNLTKDFGSEKAPKVPFSSGQKYDMMTSPLNIYLCDLDNFNNFISILEDYSWIAQNIQKCVMIPKNFVDTSDLQETHFKKDTKVTFYTLKKNGLSKDTILNFNYTFNDLLNDLNITTKELHLLRSNYVSIKLTDYSGNEVIFDSGRVNTLNFYQMVSLGYQNIIRVLLSGYGSESKEPKLYQEGDFLDTVLTLDDFDELPVFINNSQLSKANTAYTRAYNNSNTTSGRINRVLDNSNSLQDRLTSGFQLISQVSSFTDLANLYTSDYDYYRQQKAEMKTYDLQKPSVNNAKYTHAPLIKNGAYGYWLVISCISKTEMNNIKKYYQLNGFEVNLYNSKLSDVTSMSICNFVKFTGNYKLNDININYMNIIKTLFESGVYLYHYDVTKGLNVFDYDITKNERLK